MGSMNSTNTTEKQMSQTAMKWIEVCAIANPAATNEELAKSLKNNGFVSTIKEAREYVKAWILK